MNAQPYPEKTQKLLRNKAALCNMIKRIAIESGEIILKYFDGEEELQISSKSDSSPVTLADCAAEKYIVEALKTLTPGIDIVAEELAAQGKISASNDQNISTYWLIDPLDGTKEFIIGGPDFTVNIGLIEDGVPTLGVVYAPAKDELYAGHGPGTAIRSTERGVREKSIHVRTSPSAGLIVTSSKSHANSKKIEAFLQNFKIQKIIKCASSLKICWIAAGKADLYPRFGETCQWDTAAAHAVLNSAGGYLSTISGQELKYTHTVQGWINPEFIASAFEWFEEPQEAL